MLVKELIAYLEKMPKEAEVVISIDTSGEDCWENRAFSHDLIGHTFGHRALKDVDQVTLLFTGNLNY